MSGLAQILTAVIAVAALVVVVLLVRSRRLKERYAIIWLAVAIGMIGLVLARPLLDRLSASLGIQSGTTTLFVLAILVLLGVLLQLSVSLTALEERVRDVAEAIALHTADSAADDAQQAEGDRLPEPEQPIDRT